MNDVSVIIPTYNRASTIEKAIKSALTQSFPVLEILVCDDGSTDNTKQIIDSINDARLKWIDCGRNGRPAIPRNKGIAQAKGNWLAFLDSDDYWFPEKIQTQIKLAQLKNYKAVCSNAMRFTHLDNNKGNYLSYSGSFISFKDIIITNHVICSSMIIHKSLIQKTKGFPEDNKLKAIEDYALWLRVAAQTDIGYIQEPLVAYLDEPSTSIRSEDSSPLKQKNRILKNLLNWLLQNETFKFDYYRIAIGQLLYNFYSKLRN